MQGFIRLPDAVDERHRLVSLSSHTVRIGIFSDIHANLPALESAFKRLTSEGCETIVHLGDAITIGPYPAETVQFLRSNAIPCIAGNHEDDLYLGFTPEAEERMGRGEREHYLWTHNQLSSADVEFLSTLPHILDLPCGDIQVHCIHYCLSDGRVADGKIDLDRSALERAFGTGHDIVAFGHTHHALVDREKRPTFINPGSAGLHHNDGPSMMIIDADEEGKVDSTLFQVEYDHQSLLAELERRAVPDGDFIRRTFYCDV